MKRYSVALLITGTIVFAGLNLISFRSKVWAMENSAIETIQPKLEEESGAQDSQQASEQKSGEWISDSIGWWYKNPDGSYPYSCWEHMDGNWYYFNRYGYRTTGWIYISGSWYLMDPSGIMLTGWQESGSKRYYLKSSGAMVTGWQYIEENWYYFNASGAMTTGWQKIGGKWYYLDESGAMITGWQEIGDKKYYLKSSGAMVTGWQYIEENWYYFNASGAMTTGWQKIGGKWYYLDEVGMMVTGWKQLEGNWYYLANSGQMVTGKQMIGGTLYCFNSKGEMTETDLSNVIKNAAAPLGRTLYVWGGGWNAADTGSGETALYNGVWPQWEQYYLNNKNNYSYKPGQVAWKNGNRESRFYGLDCSGYLGWLIFNSVEKGKNSRGYVVEATKIAGSLAGYGYGNITSCTENSRFYPGDIVSIQGHCFLCLGQCADGSVLILHSTPNGGVQMSGTVKGSGESQASRLAREFMRKYYPDWWSSFGKEGKQSVNAGVYLNGTKFSWQISGSVSDSDNFKGKTAEQVLDAIKDIM